jgi:hypothetical protein
MKRIAVLAALAVAAALAFTASAPAKELVSLQICGASGCKTITDRVVLTNGVLEGQEFARPPAASGFYSVKGTVDAGDRTITWEMYYVPTGYMRGTTPGGEVSWLKLNALSAAFFRSASEGVEPFAKPVVTYARVGKRVARDPASYLRLYAIRSAGRRAPGKFDWIRIELRSKPPSPWTDGRNELEYSPSTRLLLRDGELVLLSKPLAKRVKRGLSLAAPSRPRVALKAGVAGPGALAFVGLVAVRRRHPR